MQRPLLPRLFRAQSVSFDVHTGLAVPRLGVAMVYLTIFLDTLAATISTPALPYYAREFGASNADIGYLFAAWSFTSTFFAPALVRLSDRIGRKRVLVMSLLGAGLANFGQATAASYWILFSWRAFSGVWAAVVSTAQVYLTDVCSPEVVDDYLAKLSAVPGAAMIFGPGLGGGLATFGLNFPIFVDGALSFVGALLVWIYLPEAPQQNLPSAQMPSTPDAQKKVPAAVAPVPRTVYVLGASGFLFGIAFGTRVSMQVVGLQAKLGFSALQVGYVYVAFAIASLSQSFWVSPWAQKRFGTFAVAIIGSLVQGTFTPIAFALMPGMWSTLAFLVISNSGFSFRNAANGPLAIMLCDPTNRGTIFAQVQMMTNFGRMVGPLIAGRLAEYDAVTWPWFFSGACSCLSAALLLPLISRTAKKPAKALRPAVEGFSDLLHAEAQPDQTGTPEDFARVGNFVGTLLRDRNYPWVSHQDAVLEMMDQLLPPLRGTPDDRLADLDLLAAHAEQLQYEFRQGGGKEQGLFT